MASAWLLALLPIAKKIFTAKYSDYNHEKPPKEYRQKHSWNPFHKPQQPMWNYFQPSYYMPKRSIHHRHLVVTLLFLVIIFLIILISGCSSSAAKQMNLYIVELKYDAFNTQQPSGSGIVNGSAYDNFNNAVKGEDFLVRIGYFGVCSKEDKKADWKCANSVNKLANGLDDKQDPFNLLFLAFELKSGTLSPWVMIIGTVLIFFTSVALIMSHSAQTMSLPMATFLNISSAIFIIIAMVWQQCSATAISKAVSLVTQNAVACSPGTPVAGLGWTSAIFTTMCACGMGIILFNEKQIEAQTGEHHGVVKRGGDMPHSAMGGPPMDPMVERYPSHHSHHSGMFGRGRSMSRHSLRAGIEPDVRMPSPTY